MHWRMRRTKSVQPIKGIQSLMFIDKPSRLTAARKSGLVWLFSAAIGLCALVFVYLRGQDKNWDLLNYHYFSGYSLLHGNYAHDLAPTGLVSFLNPLPNTLAFLALSQLAFPASAWAIALVQLLSLPLLVLIARQIGRDLGFSTVGAAELLALALCLLAPLWWSELGTSFADASTTPIVLAGLYFGLRGVAQGEKTLYALLLSGAFFGLAAGLKLTNAPFAIGFLAALLGVSIRSPWRHLLRLPLLLAGGMVIGFLLTAWWNIFLFQKWGSPLYPLYNAWFKSPYADPVNFREAVWHFKSLADFAGFLWDAVSGTARTAEFLFADARLLVFFALAAVALAAGKSRPPLGRVAVSFLLFLLVCFFVWTLVFAYQRYLIPVELLFGFGIWILLSRLTGNPNRVALLLAGCVIACALLIKVPDWGHTPSHGKKANPFGVSLPGEVSSTPARFLVVENAISYLLPFLHPDSRFYGVNVFRGLFSRQIDVLIRDEVVRESPLPLRILARQEVATTSFREILSRFGLMPDQPHLSCTHFNTAIDRYVICEIRDGLDMAQAALVPVEIDFQDRERLLPSSVLGVSGLSVQEPWGRWSDGDEVTVHFANCLPKGTLSIDLRGHAFGPNIGKPVRLALGSNQTSIVLGEGDRDLSAALENHEQCVNTLSIFVPQKTSPQELGGSDDKRKLGIGLVRLGIRAG